MTLPTGRFKVCTAETLGRDRGPHKLHPQTSDTPPPAPRLSFRGWGSSFSVQRRDGAGVRAGLASRSLASAGCTRPWPGHMTWEGAHWTAGSAWRPSRSHCPGRPGRGLAAWRACERTPLTTGRTRWPGVKTSPRSSHENLEQEGGRSDVSVQVYNTPNIQKPD